MASIRGFDNCCGASIWYGFYNRIESSIIAELEAIEHNTKGRFGIAVLILANDYHKYYEPVLKNRKGWDTFCHGATNPSHSNITSLYGYAYSATTPPKKKKVLTKRKSLFGLTRKVR